MTLVEWRNEQNQTLFSDRMHHLKGPSVVPKLSYFLHRARTCLSLARMTSDPNVKRWFPICVAQTLSAPLIKRASGRQSLAVKYLRQSSQLTRRIGGSAGFLF
jgi:hypothetical protein